MSSNTSVPYVSLANKYRPQTFEDMVGQESISKTLQNALKLGRIGHAYLFYGPRGCGKTTTARILAKALNCTGHTEDTPTTSPCGKCPQCLEIAQSADLDVLELDAASNTQVEKVREVILDTVALAAGRDRFKVFILDEVHMLSASSFNALLKTIEEPPAHVVFILATTEKHKVPATIVSRCQTFRFRPLSVEEISTRLTELAEAEGIDLSVSAAKLLAKNAGGAMRDGLTLLDRAIAYGGVHIDEKTVSDMLGLTSTDLLREAVQALCHKDNAQMHRVFETLQVEGMDANTFLKDLKNTLSELFYFTLGQGSEPFEGSAVLLQGVSTGFLARLTRKLGKLIDEVKFADNAFIGAEIGIFTIMDSVLDLDAFIRRLEALEKGEVLPPSVPAVPPAQTQSKSTSPSKPRRAQEAKIVSAQPSAASVSETAPLPVLDQAISNRQAWNQLIATFENSPFMYDMLSSSSIDFGTGDVWTVTLPPEKEFYQKSAENKLGEISAQATRLMGRLVKVKLAVSPATVVSKARPTSKEERKLAAVKTTSAQEESCISQEEPFVPGSFEKDISSVGFTDTPQEVQEILKLFPGELIA